MSGAHNGVVTMVERAGEGGGEVGLPCLTCSLGVPWARCVPGVQPQGARSTGAQVSGREMRSHECHTAVIK